MQRIRGSTRMRYINLLLLTYLLTLDNNYYKLYNLPIAHLVTTKFVQIILEDVDTG